VKRGGSPIHPLRLVHELKQGLTPDVTVCLDMGSFHLWFARHLYSFRARHVLMTNGQQTLCDEAGDVATASLLENWIDETEKRTWFLFECGRDA